MHHEFCRLGDGRKGILRVTTRAVTPFGGLAVLVELFGRLGVLSAVRERLPFQYRSNHASRPEHILLAFWLGVVAGARRFAHLQMLRAEIARCRSCAGCARFPATIRCAISSDASDRRRSRRFFRRCGGGCLRSSRRGGACSTWTRPSCSASASRRAPSPATIPRGGMAAATGRWWRLSVNRCWCCTAGCGRATRPIIAARWSFSPRRCTSCRAPGASRGGAPMRRSSTRSCSSFSNKGSCRIRSWCGARKRSSGRCTRCASGGRWMRTRRWVSLRCNCRVGRSRGALSRCDCGWPIRRNSARGHRTAFFRAQGGSRGRRLLPAGVLRDGGGVSVGAVRLQSAQRLAGARGQTGRRAATADHVAPVALRLRCAIAGRSGHNFVLYLSSAWGGLAARKPLLDKIRTAVFPTSPKLDATPATAPP